MFVVLGSATLLAYGAQQHNAKTREIVKGPRVAVDSRQHRRKYQEDAAFYGRIEDSVYDVYGTFVGVFDGHKYVRSGDDDKDGADVALFLKDNLYKFFETAEGNSIEGKMKAAFKMANEDPFVKSKPNVGSTASVAFIPDDGKTIHFAHVGDSRMWLKKKEGLGFSHVTRDHGIKNEEEIARLDKLNGAKKKGDSVDQGRFCVDGHFGVPAVSRSIGDFRSIEFKQAIIADPEYSCVPLGPENDLLILATDGITNHLTSTELLMELHCARDKFPAALVKSMGDLVQEKNSQDKKADNATFVAVDIHNQYEEMIVEDLHPQYEKKWSGKMKALLFCGGLSVITLLAWICHKSTQ